MNYWVQTNADMNPILVNDVSDAEMSGIVKLLDALASDGELVELADSDGNTIYGNYEQWSSVNSSKRTFTKYPSSYVRADYEIPSMGSADYPAFILYDPKYAIPTIYKYRQDYLHDVDRQTKQEGVYYTINEVSEDGGKTFRPLTDSERRYEVVIGWLDVCRDGDVGFIWNGRYNHFGHLEGNQVVK